MKDSPEKIYVKPVVEELDLEESFNFGVVGLPPVSGIQ